MWVFFFSQIGLKVRKISNIIFAVIVLWVSPLAYSANEFISFGDLRGHFEPCGCNPDTDMGGIERITGYINLERSRFKGLEVFSVGNNFHSDKFNIADQFIEKGIFQLNPTAMLVGSTEWIHREKLYDRQSYLLTNSKSGIFKKFVETSNSLVIGILEFEGVDVSSSDVAYINSKLKNTSKKKILLYSGIKSKLAILLKKMKFDVVLSSNFRSFSEEPDEKERVDERLLLLEGGSVKISPLGGQGVITNNIPAVSLVTSQNPLEGKSSEGVFANIQSYKNFHWLDRKALYGSKPKELIAKYKKASKNSFINRAIEKKKEIKNSNYAGSSSCKSCHVNEYSIYNSSNHAKAYKTLVGAGQHQNETCVTCHVVGFEKKGGFVSLKDTPDLAGVGCEHCHGPRKDHIKNPIEKKSWHIKSPRKVCESCHKAPHTTKFDYEEYWKRFAHGK
jgi:hypothetical protein